MALCSAATLVLCVGLIRADDKSTKDIKNGKKYHATITKVDAKNGTITVRMKDKNGKEEERMFQLAENIRYFDSDGHAATVDLFRSGNEVLVIEQEGKLVQIKQRPKNSATDKEKSTTETKPGDK
jgi:3-dehydroquinate synthase class II